MAAQWLKDIEVERIAPGANDRKRFDEAALQELSESIARYGLAQRITVRERMDSLYEIVAGERRFRAIRDYLHWATAPCVVCDLSDEAASAVMLMENMKRKDLTIMEEARAYQTRVVRFGYTVAELSRQVSISAERIQRRMKLLSLVAEAQTLVDSGQLSLTHAEALSELDGNRQRIALRVSSEAHRGLSGAEFRELVNQLLSEQSQDGLFDLERFWVEQTRTPTRGKQAVVNVPTRKDLPSMKVRCGGLSVVMEAYVRQLQEAGMEKEAATVGTVYRELVAANYLSVKPS
jgi:ParB family chromosome partitioning protein